MQSFDNPGQCGNLLKYLKDSLIFLILFVLVEKLYEKFRIFV